ncbi:uncharacterized protein LOC121972109 isoform X2 [Zingiber officinale]|uniref:uncharacterized protein LOC121972109 isoform X2 n=1 Tax=Zingiber officinale TaxID=94328 RepID=UPI001C4DC3D5|nr:uncharacterized protein LOC121972109 isoform X2 [Zingiber officinale]
MGSGGGGSMNWDGSSQISKSVKGSGRWGKKSSREEKGVWGERSVGMEKKRVMVVVDQSGEAKEAMMWALTHVANKGDLLTLLHVLPPHNPHRDGDSDLHNLAWSLGAQCKSCKPEVEVEVLVVEGPKLQTVLSQVRKLETSVLVLSQCKPSLFCCLCKTNSEDFVEQCIDEAQCLTMAVRKQSMGVGGYLVSTRWKKNFWLLA